MDGSARATDDGVMKSVAAEALPIEVSGLRKTYRSWRGREVHAVDGLDLVVDGPGVHGFLGPNGAGKTTTIRCLLGLVRPTGGSVRVLGSSVDELHTVIDGVGALVEAPKFFPTISGRRNLELLASVAGIGDRVIDQVLETVALENRAQDPFSAYSLGMKQRLAVGAALLKDPELIVLDEPANGLDPAGIVEIRLLIRRLAEEGRTVFVSSHQLSEMQRTADVLTIIHKGRVLRTGSVAEVVGDVDGQGVLVTIDDPEGGAAVLRAAGFAATVDGDGRIVVGVEPDRGSEVAEALGRSGRWLRALEVRQSTLEEAFLELTDDQDDGEVSA